MMMGAKISFSYDRTEVLRDVSLDLLSGEIVAVLGPNGSGKSTLLKVIAGHLRDRGLVMWQAKEIRTWRRNDLARIVAYLPQNPAWGDDQTVSDALRLGRAPYWRGFGLESERDARVVEEVADLLQLRDLLDRPLAELSGGQRQRALLGRCLAQEPKALLLDEPNTFLDLLHQVELGLLLRNLAKERNIAVLMASHDINLAASFADRMILLDAGTVAAVGTPAEVLRPDLLSRVYGVPIDTLPREGAAPVVVPHLPAMSPKPASQAAHE